MQNTEQPLLKSSRLFIHGELDDFGLEMAEFRAYCHIARRAGDKGECFASIYTVSKVCRMHPQTARKSIRNLIASGLIQATERPGRTTIYRLAQVSQWKATPTKMIHPYEKDRGVSVSEGRGTKMIEGYPYEDSIDEVTPSEVTPLKVIPSLSKKRFVPPTLDEATEYAKERGKPELAEAFFDHHKARGWKFKSGLPVSDWKAAFRTWQRNAPKFAGYSNSKQPIKPDYEKCSKNGF